MALRVITGGKGKEGEALMRWPEVERVVGLARETVRKMERAGQFPPRVQITDRTVGWRKADVLRWVSSRQTSDDFDGEGDAA